MRRRAAEARLRDYGEEATSSGAVAAASNGVVGGASFLATCSPCSSASVGEIHPVPAAACCSAHCSAQ